MSTRNTLTPNQFAHFLRLVSALSPENLHCYSTGSIILESGRWTRVDT